MENANTLKIVGNICKEFRRKRLGITQKEVARENGYSVENVSSFENGRTNNALLFVWYFLNGLDIDFFYNELDGGVGNGT